MIALWLDPGAVHLETLAPCLRSNASAIWLRAGVASAEKKTRACHIVISLDRNSGERLPLPPATSLLFYFVAASKASAEAASASAGAREVAHRADHLVHIGQIEVDEGGDLRLLLQDLGIGVDEQRAGQLVLAGIHARRVGATPSTARSCSLPSFSTK